MASSVSGSQLVVVRPHKNSVEVIFVGDSRPSFEINYGLIVSYNRVCKEGDLEIGDILDLMRKQEEEKEHIYAVLRNVEVMSGIVKTVDGNKVHLRTEQNIPINVPVSEIETENRKVAVNDELELFKVKGKFRKAVLKRAEKRQPEPRNRSASREIPIQPEPTSIEISNPPRQYSPSPNLGSIIPQVPYIIPQTYRLDLKSLFSPIPSISPLSQFESYTPCKKDGNSLYRAIAIQYLEYLLRSITDEIHFDSYLKTLESSRDPLAYILSDEYRRSYISQLVSLRQKKSYDRLSCMKFLVDLFNDKKFDDGMVAEFRMALGFYYYHNHASLPSEDPDPNECFQNIMRIGIDGSRVTIACAAKALGVFIKVVYPVTNSEEIFESDESEGPLLNLCMREEGYDALYTSDHNIVDNYNIITKRFNDHANIASYDRSKLFYTKLKPVEQPRLFGIPRIQPSPIKSKNISEDIRPSPPSSIPSPPNPPHIKAPAPIEEIVVCLECRNSVLKSELFTDKVCSCNICIRCYYLLRESTSVCNHCKLPLSNKNCTNCFRYILDEEILNTVCATGNVCKYCIIPHIINCKQCQNLEEPLRDEIQLNQINYQNNPCDCCGHNESLNHGCAHNVCKECLVNYLKFQIDNDIFDYSGIKCLLCEHRIHPEKFLLLLSQDYKDKFNRNYIKRIIRNVSCPNCSTMFPVSVLTQACTQCNTALCIRCLKQFHEGECPIDEVFFSIYPRICLCPKCGNLNGKIKFDTYKKICKNPVCGTPYCIDCGALYGPIAIHGEGYHKPGCKHRRENPIQVRCDMINCYSCREQGRLCDKPE